MQKNHFSYLFLAIGLMTVGQVPAGIYLPSLINMSEAFHVSVGAIQSSVGIYLLAYGLSQLVYGPLSDHYGRKPTVVGGLILFALGSIVSFFANSIFMLDAGSLIQGLGLGSVAVMSSAILRDLHHDKKLMASLSSMSAAVIVAPIIGGYLQDAFGWRANFAFMLIYGVLMLMLALLYLQETNAKVQTGWIAPLKVLQNYGIVIKTRGLTSNGTKRYSKESEIK